MPLVKPLGKEKYNVFMLEYDVSTARPAAARLRLEDRGSVYNAIRFTFLTTLH